MISQASLLQRVLQHVNASHISPLDRICPLSSPCTISGVREQLAALLTGATLHILDPHRESLNNLRRSIGDQRISIIYAVPALLRAVVQAEGLPEDLFSLRVVRLGGDAVLWRDVLLLRGALAPDSRIQVGFSSTESPGLQWFIPPDFPVDGATVPLGYELPGMRVEIIDESGVPVRPGEIGELVIRSRFVALGLWQDGICVEGVFQPDPQAPGARLNRSGDLAWLRPDGLYCYAGRKDRQAKIRGQRVDTSEVEAVLRTVPGVLDAVVAAISDAHETSLVAFAQTATSAETHSMRLQADAALRSLPQPMRPSRLHLVASIPRLPSAKPDLAALNALDQARRTARKSLGRPTLPVATKTERTVAKAWRAALGPQAARGDQTWSQAGGDSLGMLEFALNLERLMGRDLPLELFDGDMRLQGLASEIDRLRQFVPPRSDARPLVLYFPGIDGDSLTQIRFRRSLQHLAHFEVVPYCDWDVMLAQGGGLDRMVSAACDKILDLPSDVPVGVVGYSFGAVAALAFASRLAGQGRYVTWLIALDTNLAQFTDLPERALHANTNMWNRLGLAQRLGWRQRLQRTRTAGWRSATLSLLTWLTLRQRLPPVPVRLPHRVRLPRALHAKIRETMRRDMMAAWLHRRNSPPADIPVVLFRTEVHPKGASLDLGWSAFAGPVQTHRVDGDHRTMLFPPYGAALTDKVARICFNVGEKAPADS